jgi:hypothetical protein
VHFARFGYVGDAERIFDELLEDPRTRNAPRVLFPCAYYLWQLRDTREGYERALELYDRILALPAEARASCEAEARAQREACRRELATLRGH